MEVMEVGELMVEELEVVSDLMEEEKVMCRW